VRGKVLIVTGASSGIGKALALGGAAEWDDRVVMAARNMEAAMQQATAALSGRSNDTQLPGHVQADVAVNR
jgi:NAD(P)-dependent dehydrogenase (short-subunit alcohol dehydrogenase family)